MLRGAILALGTWADTEVAIPAKTTRADNGSKYRLMGL